MHVIRVVLHDSRCLREVSTLDRYARLQVQDVVSIVAIRRALRHGSIQHVLCRIEKTYLEQRLP